jgi:uncharacterized protein YndB with AHSA1/START domain
MLLASILTVKPGKRNKITTPGARFTLIHIVMEKSIIIEQEYPHSQEDVWEALTDQSYLNDWLMQGNFVPRVGAEFEFFWSGNDASNGSTHGTVVEAIKPNKLSYTWGWGEGSTLVTFFLEPSGAGTKLRLEHTGFVEGKDEHVYQGASYGWNRNLAALPAAIEKRKNVSA